MKDILVALGGIVGFFLFIVAVLVVTIIILIKIYFPKVKRFFTQQAEAFQQAVTESQQFARSTVLAVLTDWQADALLRSATPQLLETVAGGDLDTVFAPWQRLLGGLISCGEMVTKESLSAGTGLPGESWSMTALATATYLLEVQCERGVALAELQVIKRGDHWSVNTFNLATDQEVLNLGIPTTLEAMRQQDAQVNQLESAIDVPAIEPEN
ncbi:hypothetical protein [Trichothermofontia sp.]